MNDLIKILVAVAVVGGIFVYLWRQGYLDRLTTYVRATREELRKCTWPTLEELKGSTVVVGISILLLGSFTVVTDYVVVHALRLLVRSLAA